ncbi:MAG: serine/threonine-protein kinase [Planctomycetes bacterium]|nr:serine/threonine-protein kinase [Planctomycetota bacterium]
MDPRPLELSEGEVISSVSHDGESNYFEVTRKLGVGGAGVVYECISDDGEPAVIKAPKMIGAKQPGLESEASWLKSIPQHPNLIRFLGMHRDPRGHTLIILERVYGNPLRALNREAIRERLKGRPTPGGRFIPLPPSTALELAYEIARGLEHLHKGKIAHCDVKPENVLLRLDCHTSEISDKDYFGALAKGDWRGVLIDLGGARSFKQLSHASAGAKGVELPSLTPIYTPPEVLPGTYDPKAQRERSRFSPWIDTYAFGLTVYQLVTGMVPYEHLESPPDEEDLRQIAETKRDERDGAFLPIARAPLDRLEWGDATIHPTMRKKYCSREEVVDRLWELLARCVHWDPVRRGTMKQMRGDLGELIGVAPAPPDTRNGPVAREWIQRRFTLDAFSSRLVDAGRGPVEKINLNQIRRGGSDFWEMQGFRPTNPS